LQIRISNVKIFTINKLIICNKKRHVLLYDIENNENIAAYTFGAEPGCVCISPD